jgi:dTDP-glucose pyrophosphorylase
MTRSLADTVVLIPAAGGVPEGILALGNIGCPAMIPVAGRPVIYWTMKYLRSLGLRRFVIAVSRRGMFVEDFVDCTFGQDCEVSFIVPTVNRGVGRTVRELAETAQANSALVVLGDTYFQFADSTILSGDEPAVLVEQVDDPYRWCTVEIDPQGRIAGWHDKEAGLAGPQPALIGVYYFPDALALTAAAISADERADAEARRTELADILKNIATDRPILAVSAGDWLDCGNPDRRDESHRALLQKREFNELSIDSLFGVVTKRSRHVEKFLDEINYLRLLPSELAVLFPRVVGYSTDYHDPWLAMEYYGYPTLAEVFVFENVDPAIWEHVFVHLRDIVERGFMQRRYPLSAGALRDMYLDKTRKRLDGLRGPPELLRLVRHEGEVVVNGRAMPNIPALWERIEAEVDRLAANVQGCIVHGDLCLSNILYDLRSRVCKLLDPRGSFGAAGIHGDPRYDVAKLYHSTCGLYDFITNDLFHVSIAGNAIQLEIRSRPQHREIRERFEKVFFGKRGPSAFPGTAASHTKTGLEKAEFPLFERREILLLTGLLFASMPALHYDAPARQIAMYARSLQLFDELFAPAAAEPFLPPSLEELPAAPGKSASTPSPLAPS